MGDTIDQWKTKWLEGLKRVLDGFALSRGPDGNHVSSATYAWTHDDEAKMNGTYVAAVSIMRAMVSDKVATAVAKIQSLSHHLAQLGASEVKRAAICNATKMSVATAIAELRGTVEAMTGDYHEIVADINSYDNQLSILDAEIKGIEHRIKATRALLQEESKVGRIAKKLLRRVGYDTPRNVTTELTDARRTNREQRMEALGEMRKLRAAHREEDRLSRQAQRIHDRQETQYSSAVKSQNQLEQNLVAAGLPQDLVESIERKKRISTGRSGGVPGPSFMHVPAFARHS